MENVAGNSTRRSIVRICIDGFEKNDFSGRLESPLLGSQPFYSVLDMASQLEDFYNEIKYPHNIFQMRSFSCDASKKDYHRQTSRTSSAKLHWKPVEGYTEEAGLLATFSVQVLFRHNATWQGNLRWLEKDYQQKFQSALELFYLIAGALRAEKSCPYDTQFSRVFSSFESD